MKSVEEMQFRCLHGLRGFLALWVLALHCTSSNIGFINIHKYGYLAVDMFFVMSGFILMHAHNRDF